MFWFYDILKLVLVLFLYRLFPALSSLAGSEFIFLDCLAKLISSLNLQGNKD